DLQRDATADGLRLLGEEHDAEAALADLLEEAVRTDPAADGLKGARGGEALELGGGGLEEGPLLVERAEERADAVEGAGRVLAAGGGEEALALPGVGDAPRLVEHGLLVDLGGFHVGRWVATAAAVRLQCGMRARRP